MKYKDYYETMGVARDATQAESKRAYRKLARKYHPDVSKAADAEQRFKDVGEAYAVLKDPEKRASYDELGADFKSGQDFSPPPDWGSGFEFSGRGFDDADGYSDFFSTLFGEELGRTTGRRGYRASPSRGEDHHAKVMIDLEDAFHGTTRSIQLRTPRIDETGHVTTAERTLNVKIPKGVQPGQHIRLAGQGSPGQGQAGDLYLEIEFKTHRIYRIEGKDLYLELPITPWEAALGDTVKCPTPAGAVNLGIPPKTTTGHKLRLKGRGIPGDPPGDLYAIARIATPAADTEAAKLLYRKMQQELPYDPRSELGV
jgi:curved DNA-binding protein